MPDKRMYVVPDWALPRWIKVAYLIINWNIRDLAERIQVGPQEQFYKVVNKHLQAYVQDGVMPPDDIAPAILNLADDHMAGKELCLRAGDYIAIQNHVRKMK